MARGSTSLPNLAARDRSVAIKNGKLILSGSSAALEISGSTSATRIDTNDSADTNLASESFVANKISTLVASAPDALNTLDELANALGDDANFATTTSTALNNRLRVDTASQGLTTTQKSNARTNLGLGSAATSATGDFATAAQGTKADTAYGWGNHASAGYLTSINNSNWSGADLSLANGGTGASLTDPNADRILFWDDSAGAITWLTPGTNITISGTTISATDTNTTYSVGDGGLTEINFTSALKTKLDGIAASANNYSLPIASALTLGGIKVGSNLSIDANGVLSATDTNTTYSVGDGGLTQKNFTTALYDKLNGIDASANNYSLPTATASVLGGVKIGSRISIASGVISADVQSDNNFTAAYKTKLDGIAASANNYSLPTASASVLGGIKVGTNLSIDGNGVLSATDTNTTYSVGDGGLTQKNFTTTLYNKLNGIADSADNYGSWTISDATNTGAITSGRTLEFRGRGATTITYDNATGVVNIESTDTDTTYSVGNGGLTEINFTSALNTKLAGIATGANNYSLPTATASVLGGVKIGSRISIASGVISADVQSDNNFTTAYKTKIDGIEAGATADQTAAEILTAIKTVDGASSGLDADLLDGNHSSAFATAAQGTKADTAYGWGNHASAGYAASSHKYHTFSGGQYYYDSYAQGNYLRMFTQTANFDNVRFRPYSNVESSADGSTWVTHPNADAMMTVLLDGREDTGYNLPLSQRGIRFEISRNSGWPTTTLVVWQETWSGLGRPNCTMKIETWDGSAWVVRDSSITFNSSTTSNNYGTHMYVSDNLHNGQSSVRVTVVYDDWSGNTNYPSYSTVPLRNFMLLSNYSGLPIHPFSWDYYQNFYSNGNVYATGGNSTQWNTAYGWGNHASAGYLTSQTSHADVVVDGDFTSNGLMKRTGAGTYAIVTDNSSNWNTAYGWGNHASAGYLTSLGTALVDADFTSNGLMKRTAAGTYAIVTDNSSNWDTAYGWGNHASAGYITSLAGYATTTYVDNAVAAIVDTAPDALNTLNELAAALGDDANFATTTATSLGNRLRVDTASQGLNATQQSNGRTNLGLGTAATTAATAYATAAQGTKADTAYGWGNHASAGYLTSQTSHADVVVDGDFTSNGLMKRTGAGTYGIITDNSSNWNTAYGWGNHASQGYITQASRLYEDSTIRFGQSNLQWTDLSGVGGTGLDGSTPTNPSDDWYHHLIMNHGNGAGYYFDLAGSFHSDTLSFRRLVNGSLQNWRRIWHDGDFSSTNVSNWNTAYGWGNHASAGYAASAHTHTFASLTSKPTTLAGYGITDAATSAQGTKADTAYGWGNHASAGYLTSVTNISGNAGTVSGLTINNSGSPINPDNVTQNQIGYNTNVSLFSQSDGGLYSSAYSSSWIHQIYGDFRSGQIAIRGKNNGTWQAWRSVLDSSNFSTWAATAAQGTKADTAYSWGNHASAGYLTSYTDTNTVTSIRRDNTGTYRTGNINLVGGANVTITETSAGVFSFAATDTNTTYSVGDGGLTQINFTTAFRDKLNGIAAGANNYSLPVASTTVLGGVKAGTNISIDANGVISATDTNTTYSVGDGGLTQKNFTTTLYNKLNGIADSADNFGGFSIGDAGTARQFTIGSGGQINFRSAGATGIAFDAASNTITISSTDTDTNTTYSAGSGLSLSGTTFSHADTSAQGSVNNSGRTFIQDITLDTYGHVIGITSATDADTYTGTVTSVATSGGLTGGTITSTGTISISSDARPNANQYFGNSGGEFFYYDNTNALIRGYINSVERMRLDSSGNVQFYGDVIAYSSTLSDARLKDNIVTIGGALDKVKRLRGVEYDWTAGARKGQHDLGLIAQEVEEVIPEVVREKELSLIDGQTYKTVDYEKLIGVLVEAMKEQQSQIDSLKSEIEILKSK